jgi:hypothetical protein
MAELLQPSSLNSSAVSRRHRLGLLALDYHQRKISSSPHSKDLPANNFDYCMRASSCADQLASCGGKIIVDLICWTDSRHSTTVVRRSHIHCTPTTSAALRRLPFATTRRARSCALVKSHSLQRSTPSAPEAFVDEVGTAA